MKLKQAIATGLILTTVLLGGSAARAADEQDAATTAPAQKKAKTSRGSTDNQDIRDTGEIKSPGSSTPHIITPQAEDLQNNRMKTLEGSKSAWSGQLNFAYNGSSLSHPFSEFAPNPGNDVPPPVVNLSGTVSVRYRIDASTTAGIGTGITTETPFQGPSNTTVADPYADIARSWAFGPIHDRLDFQFTLWTDNQYHSDLGYNVGLTLSNEAFYEFGFGLTAGLFLELDYNIFSGAPEYSSGYSTLANQTQWDLQSDPYFEYSVSKRVNLRTVIGIQSENNRNYQSSFAFFHPKIYETLGIGVQILDAWYVYPFIKFYPYSMIANNTVVGFSTIINLF